MTNKKCNVCGITKPSTDFHKRGPTGLQVRCKECNKAGAATWRRSNPEREKAKQARCYAANTDHAKARMAKYKKANPRKVRELNLKRYNITLVQYEQLLANQSECCSICKKHQSDFSKALCVDHDHGTGQVRGLLCSQCNTAIGLLQDNPATATAAAEYLRKRA